MGHAKYVGRVGALAVTLGVGLAMASTPAIAYATPSDSSSSTSDSSSTKKSSSSTSTSSSTTKGSAGDDATSTDGSDDTDSSASDVKSPSGSADRSTVETDVDADDDTGDDGDDAEEDAAEDPTSDVEDETPPATGDEETPPADAASENDDVTVTGSASGHGLHGSIPSNAAGKVESSVTPAVGQSNRSRLQTSNTDAVADASVDDSSAVSVDAVTTFATMFSSRTATAAVAPTAPQQQPTIVSVVSDLVAAVLQPFMSPGTGSPILPSLLLGLLSAVRNEIERALFRNTTNAAPQYTVTQIDPTPNSVPADPTPNVLVIGVDGTNLSRILADDENDNFFALMDDGTTAASSIVGHTTISNPSWSAILTGVWSERTGVINNVFTPSTYDKWPTVFNQLEADNSDIETTAIADWDVINAIAGAGSIPVDENIYIPQIEGDTDWSQTDDAVGDATVDAIEDTPVGVPTFLFSYFVGVDENGHMHGGASPEYAAAIRNVDENLGEILAAVEAWETAHPDEGEWTIIVVTDHGHQPQQGFGHGFQTPDETATFVIASGPDFNDGWVNPDYEIVDTTPTVLTLFGAPVPENLDGVSLTTLGGSDELPDDLHQALEDMIAENHSPDIVTNVALSLRTIFATIPYYVWTLTNDGTLPGPVGTVLYVATNIPAQIVALLTGATGASIFPLLPPGPPSWPGQEATTDTAILACGGGELGSAADVCDAASVA
jgi:Type I phosphodiesterase / nucleotide pyrophosphatase